MKMHRDPPDIIIDTPRKQHMAFVNIQLLIAYEMEKKSAEVSSHTTQRHR